MILSRCVRSPPPWWPPHARIARGRPPPVGPRPRPRVTDHGGGSSRRRRGRRQRQTREGPPAEAFAAPPSARVGGTAPAALPAAVEAETVDGATMISARKYPLGAGWDAGETTTTAGHCRVAQRLPHGCVDRRPRRSPRSLAVGGKAIQSAAGDGHVDTPVMDARHGGGGHQASSHGGATAPRPRRRPRRSSPNDQGCPQATVTV